MKLYDKLKSVNLIADQKEYLDLIRIREIKVNDYPVDNPIYEIEEKDHIRVGIKSILF
jgi:predicted rRNA methylase YqxC with S4 and FtsJ domains